MEGKFAFHVFFLTCPQPAAINSRGLGIGSTYSFVRLVRPVVKKCVILCVPFFENLVSFCGEKFWMLFLNMGTDFNGTDLNNCHG
jgi:hypothetical protein